MKFCEDKDRRKARSWACGIVLVGAVTASGQVGPAVLPELPHLNLVATKAPARSTIQKSLDAVTANPREAGANGKLGMVLHAAGFPAEAEACYKRARLLDASAFHWAYYLALAKAEQGKWNEAAATLSEALRLDPKYIPARLKLGGLLLALGRWPEATQIFEAVMKESPDNAEGLYGLGRARAVRNDLEGAVDSLRKACEIFPNHGPAHYALAQTYKRQGKMTLAAEQLALFEKNPAATPDAGDGLLAEIQALNVTVPDELRDGQELMRQGKLAEAAAKLEQALESYPELVEAHIPLISIYARLGQFAKGEEHFQAAVRLDPRNPANYHNHGLLFASQGKFPEAGTEFRRALEIDPAFPGARTDLGLALEAQQRFSEALSEFRASVKRNPGDITAHFALGRILVNQESYFEGIDHLLECVKSDDVTNKPAYLYALGAAYARSGDVTNGVRYLRQARQAAAAGNQPQMVENISQDLKTLEKEPPAP